MTSAALQIHLEGLIRKPVPKYVGSLDVDETIQKPFPKPFIFK